MRLVHIWIIVLLLMLAACGQGAVQFAPTPLPPNLSPVRYEHPSGAFSLILPQDWSVYSQNLTTLATTAFSPPNSDEPLVLVAVVNLGRTIEAQDLGGLMFDYQTKYRPDLEYYKEQDRQPLSDGSWRLTGLRTAAGGQTQQINTFVQRAGSFLVVIEVIVPTDANRLAEVQSIINTFEANPDADLPVSDLSALSSASASSLAIANVKAWSTSEGAFFITGEVVNHGLEPLSEVPVRAVLWSEEDVGLVEAVDMVMGYTLVPGGFAPFGLRFGQRPPDSGYYTVEVGGENWVPVEPYSVLTTETLTWTHDTQFNDAGDLLVTGTVTNTSSQTVRDALAVATILDETGLVIGAGFAPVQDDLLAPDESSDYTILLQDVGGTPTNYLVQIQGLPAE